MLFDEKIFRYVLLKIEQGQESLTENEIKTLLLAEEKKDLEAMFELARKKRKNNFGDKVFTYGFVYFSTFCQNSCTFCLYRKENSALTRYRKKSKDIIDSAKRLAESGVNLLDFTMGEDPLFFQKKGFDDLIALIREIKAEIGLPIMISPGLVEDDILARFQEAGADWYACYQETHNRELFQKIRLGQDYDRRLQAKITAKKLGMLIEEGLLSGIGEKIDDVIHSLKVMKEIKADQIRVMSFVPQENTPLAGSSHKERLNEMKIIAVMRLLFPDKLIPASLDVDGIQGLEARLQAGANVVTSIIPPDTGLAGVSQNSLDIQEGYRSIKGIDPILKKNNLRRGTQKEYEMCLQKLQREKSE